jgi:hypothetical protein
MESGFVAMRLHTDGRNEFVQEYEMFRLNEATYPAADADPSYVGNLCRATLALFAAIFPSPVRSGSASAKPAVSNCMGVKARNELCRLAREMESTMPNQAAELRYLSR